MKEELISFETAKLLYSKGFCIATQHKYSPSGELINMLKQQIKEDNKTYTVDKGCLWEYVEKGNLENLMDLCDNSLTYVSDSEDVKYREYLAPTQSLLQKYLREKHNIHIYVEYNWSFDCYTFHIGIVGKITRGLKKFKKFEKALEEGLQESLKLLQ